MLLRTRFLACLSVICLSAAAPVAVAVEDVEEAEAPLVIEPNTQAIEGAIGGLSHPVSDEQVVAILAAIGQLPDLEEQERLRQALNDKGHELNQAAATSTSSGQPPLGSESSDEEFHTRIGGLQLGTDATAAELRARDEVVSAIVGVNDPTRREQLLKALEERERQAETLVEPSAAR